MSNFTSRVEPNDYTCHLTSYDNKSTSEIGINTAIPTTHISALPTELMLKLFSFLNIEDICFSVPYVCTFWSELSEDNLLWAGLKFVCPIGMSNSQLFRIFEHAPKLKNVRFNWRTDINEILNVMMHHCENLQRIEVICSGGSLHEDTLSVLADSYPELKHLSFEKCWYTNQDCFENVWKFSMIESLDLSHLKITGETLRNISINCPLLNDINIDYVKNIQDEDMLCVIEKKKETLLSLSIYGECLSDVVFVMFRLCTNLQKLHISSCTFLSNPGLEGLSKCSNVTSLKLRRALNINVNGLRRFLNSKLATKLKYLSLSRSECFDNECAAIIARNCSSLEELDLMYCSAYNSEIKDCIIEGCKNLKVVYNKDDREKQSSMDN